MHRRHRRLRRRLGDRRTHLARSSRVDWREVEMTAVAADTSRAISTSDPLRVACVGMGWWSDVLADAVQRSGKIKIVSCYTRTKDKAEAFATKYKCKAAASYEAILADPSV